MKPSTVFCECATLESRDDTAMDDLLSHSITYRIAVGPHQGEKAFTLQTLAPRGEDTEDEGMPCRMGTAGAASRPVLMRRLTRRKFSRVPRPPHPERYRPPSTAGHAQRLESLQIDDHNSLPSGWPPPTTLVVPPIRLRKPALPRGAQELPGGLVAYEFVKFYVKNAPNVAKYRTTPRERFGPRKP